MMPIHWVPREQWGAKAPKRVYKLRNPVPEVFIHHTVTGQTDMNNRIEPVVKSVQNWHMSGRGWTDIAYNYLVGYDGRVFIGRGLNKGGATKWHNSKSVSICLIGNYEDDDVTDLQHGCLTDLIFWLKENGTVQSTASILPHRSVKATACPGARAMDKLFPNGQYLAKNWSDPEPIITIWPYPGRTVRTGKWNAKSEVKIIQVALENYGYNPGPIDGIYGKRTNKAVRTFQRANHLTVDGVVGPQTWRKLVG